MRKRHASQYANFGSLRVRQIMSDSQRTEEERAHTKILKTERELFFRMKFSASIKF